MSMLFYGCSLLTSLDLNNFNTSQVKNMDKMFNDCTELCLLNISNFDTSRVTDMYNMFYNCKALRSLNLFNFDTTQVKNMSNMFYNCYNLNFLNISNFYTPFVTEMNQMFYNCESLNSLDLSNFNFTNLNNFNAVFKGCNNLEYINLFISNINPKLIPDDIFSSTTSNLIICSDNNSYSNDSKLKIILPDAKIYKCNNSYPENKYICYMKNSSFYNEHLCDICKKRMSIYYHALSNNSNFGCYESEDDYNDHLEFTSELLLSETHLFLK